MYPDDNSSNVANNHINQKYENQVPAFRICEPQVPFIVQRSLLLDMAHSLVNDSNRAVVRLGFACGWLSNSPNLFDEIRDTRREKPSPFIITNITVHFVTIIINASLLKNIGYSLKACVDNTAVARLGFECLYLYEYLHEEEEFDNEDNGEKNDIEENNIAEEDIEKKLDQHMVDEGIDLVVPLKQEII